MDSKIWTSVDEYIGSTIVGEDDMLRAAVRASEAAGLPSIQVAPNQGKLLNLLARMVGARRILEIGTLGGYSTIWLARALPTDGELISLEIDEHHAGVARANVGRAGLGDRVSVVVGPALETLPTLAGPFDLAFIDADKQNIPAYVERTIAMSRPGTVIVVDNVVRGGDLVDAASADEAVRGVRALHEMLATNARVEATTIQTVGSKGYDGLLVAVVH